MAHESYHGTWNCIFNYRLAPACFNRQFLITLYSQLLNLYNHSLKLRDKCGVRKSKGIIFVRTLFLVVSMKGFRLKVFLG